MKKLLILLFTIASFSGQAQFENYYSKFDVHAGYSLPLGRFYPINGGFCIDAEPKFWYNDYLVFGGKFGFNFLTSPVESVKLQPLTTIALLGEKYKGDKDFAYFYGASVGLYSGGQTRRIAGTGPTGLKSPKALGLAPRAGIQFGNYKLLAEYHMRKDQVKFISIMLGYTW
jgi:hypothetical protein